MPKSIARSLFEAGLKVVAFVASTGTKPRKRNACSTRRPEEKPKDGDVQEG
jgi:hypothetical protein